MFHIQSCPEKRCIAVYRLQQGSVWGPGRGNYQLQVCGTLPTSLHFLTGCVFEVFLWMRHVRCVVRQCGAVGHPALSHKYFWTCLCCWMHHEDVLVCDAHGTCVACHVCSRSRRQPSVSRPQNIATLLYKPGKSRFLVLVCAVCQTILTMLMPCYLVLV